MKTDHLSSKSYRLVFFSIITIVTILISTISASSAAIKGIGYINDIQSGTGTPTNPRPLFYPWPSPVNNPPHGYDTIDWYDGLLADGTMACSYHVYIPGTPFAHQRALLYIDQTHRVFIEKGEDGTMWVCFSELVYVPGVGWVWQPTDTFFLTSDETQPNDFGVWIDADVVSAWLHWNDLMDTYEIILQVWDGDQIWIFTFMLEDDGHWYGP